MSTVAKRAARKETKPFPLAIHSDMSTTQIILATQICIGASVRETDVKIARMKQHMAAAWQLVLKLPL
jgi:hypothetical protein